MRTTSRPDDPGGISCSEATGGAELRINVKPRASHTGLGGVRDGVLVVRVSAPPVDGEANAACCKFLAKLLGVAPSSVRIARGAGSRLKTVRVDGISSDVVRARLRAALPS